MNFGLLFFQFTPLIAYLAFDYWKGFRAGIYAAMVASLVILSYDFIVTGEIDRFVLGEVMLIIGLGIVSLRMNNDRWFKFQPTVVGLVFSGVFAYFQLSHQPLMNEFIPHMEKLLGAQEPNAEPQIGTSTVPTVPTVPDTLAMLRDPRIQQIFAALSQTCIWLFLGHAL
ncbi:MAG: septation protein IspZ, partial [Oligoflexus sp.]